MSTNSSPRDSHQRTAEDLTTRANAESSLQASAALAAPNGLPSASAEQLSNHLQQSTVTQSHALDPTASTDIPLSNAVDSPLASSGPGDLANAPEPSAGGGQVGASEAQPEKPANAEDGLRDTSNEPITAQKDATLGASDTRQGGTNAAQPPQSGTTTEQPRRRIIDLSDPLGSEVDTNTTKADETKQTSTYASVLKQSIDGSRKSDVICYLNQPSHSMLLRLIELAENESTTDEEMHDAIQQALPYPKRVGTGTFWIETASALASETNDKIIRSILGDNQDAPWSSLMMDFLQINKARGGDAVVSVTSEETRLAMLGQTISILGKDYKVSAPRTGGKTRKTNTKKQNGVDELYYMDIVGTRYNFDSLALLKGLRRLKTNPLYVTYKSTYDQKQNGAPAHPNIWRVYFNTKEQPPALTVNGLVIEEIVLQGVRYGVFVKNYVRQTTQRNGRESQHCIDFDKLLN
ncbi:unnamed protein product, partial [Aphanomyces euteiches]